MNQKSRLCAVVCLLLTLSLFPLLLGGCAGPTKTVTPIVDAPVDLQETQNLLIYIPASLNDYTVPQKVTEEYQSFYSKVKVTLEYVPEESYGSRVATELMAGGGPDVIFPSWLKDSDLYKMMDSGAFLNLNQIIGQDGSFHSEDYVDGVLEAAQYKGGQYLIPLSYRTVYLLSSTEAVDDAGLSEEGLSNLFSLLEEATQITQEKIDSGDPDYLSFWGGYSTVDSPELLPELFFDSDISLVDYESRIPLPEEEALRKWLEAEKKYAHVHRISNAAYGSSLETACGMSGFGGICKGAYSVDYETISSPYHIARTLFGAKGEKQTPFIHGLPGANCDKVSILSEFLAINSNSKNQQNAWNYIKLALALSSQGSRDSMDFLHGFPILKAAFSDRSSMLQSWIKPMGPSFNKDSDLWGCHFDSMTEEEWNAFVAELATPGKLILPESGPVKTMFQEAVTPYFTEDANLDECLSQLKNQLQLYVSE